MGRRRGRGKRSSEKADPVGQSFGPAFAEAAHEAAIEGELKEGRMKRKRPGIMLTADELDIVRRAIDLGREVIGDWLEDKLCSIADNDSASSNCETSPGWNLS